MSSPAGQVSKREQRWIGVFRRLRTDGEIHRDALPQAIELAGLGACPDPGWISQVYEELTRFSTLDLREFTRFLYAYKARQLQHVATTFKRFDVNGNGLIDTNEFADVLESCGVTPLDQVVYELLMEVGQRNMEGLTEEEFRRAFEFIRDREGFSRREVERFRRAFAKFDLNHSSTLDISELHGILGWLGYASSAEEARAVSRICCASATATGAEERQISLGEAEFLVCMRKVREKELANLRWLMNEYDLDRSGALDREELANLLRSFGYVPDPRAIQDAAEDIGRHDLVGGTTSSDGGKMRPKPRGSRVSLLMPRLCRTASSAPLGHSAGGGGEWREEMNLDDLWNFLEVYRIRDGFSREEAAGIAAAFDRYDRDRAGQISTLEVGKVLRWFGYPSTWELQQHLIAEVDVNSSGRLDRYEVQKLVRKYRERHALKIQQAFEEYDTERGGKLSEVQAEAALRSLGYMAKRDRKRVTFVRQGSIRSASSVSSVSEDSSSDESSRAVPVAELVAVTSQEAPLPLDAATVTLPDFVDWAWALQHEARLVFRDSAGYSAKEVEDMKKRFKHYDTDDSGDISNTELRRLLAELFPRLAHSAKMRPYLLRLMQEVDADLNGKLDFPDFLRLMRQFHDLQAKDGLIKEQRARRKTGFSTQEVEEFRKVFMDAAPSADETGPGAVMNFSGLANMLGRFCPLGDRYLSELSDLFNSIVGEDLVADFPEFLELMRKLLDLSFANLDEHAEKAAIQTTRVMTETGRLVRRESC